MKNKIYKQNKGITLIALVITIIVLLILAGVAISMLSGENGILKKAGDAKVKTGEASTNEGIKVAAMTALTVGKGKIEGDDALNALNTGLKEIGITEVKELPAKITTDGGTYVITKEGVKEPVRNKYDANGWDIAYTYTAGKGWSEAITEKNADLSGNIVAKLYATGETSNVTNPLTGATDEEVPVYKLVVEGTGEMGAVMNDDLTEFYAWYNDVCNGTICLSEVTICDGITSVADLAFYDFKILQRVNVAASVLNIGNSAFYGCTMLKDLDLLGTNILGREVFYRCTKLTNVNAQTITNIGGNAFYECGNLVGIDLQNVTEIGNYAFASCVNLASVVMPKVTNMGEYVFYGCKALIKIELPEGVKNIGESVFGACIKLKTIKIPNSVETIEKDAFLFCEDLKNIYYSGTADEWNNITIEEHGNTPLTSATIHYGS